MTDPLSSHLLALFLLFSRVGGCLMVAPGLSSPRVPVQVRLFVAFGVAAAMSPMVITDLQNTLAGLPQEQQAMLIPRELAIGLFIGLLARCFVLALQFAATAISNFIGLAGIPGIALEEADTGSPLATLASTAAVTIIFALGLHIELLRALLESYAVLPLGGALSAEVLLNQLLRTLAETWLLALRLAGPFLLYGVTVNVALGLGNRFAQQISMYHATSGVVMLGGFLLLYLIWADWALVFADAYRAWLLEGGF